MALLRGPVSYVRYQLDRPLTPAAQKKISDLLFEHRARELKLQASQLEQKVGWVPPFQEEGPRFGKHWDLSDCELSQGWLLKMRIESRSVPRELLSSLARERILEIEATTHEPLRGAARKDVLDELRNSLIERALPKISYVEAFLNQRGRLFLYCQSKTRQELFLDLFNKCFVRPLEAKLFAIEPPMLALSRKEWEHPDNVAESMRAIARLVPCPMVDTEQFSQTLPQFN